jgi:hypothetical protein
MRNTVSLRDVARRFSGQIQSRLGAFIVSLVIDAFGRRPGHPHYMHTHP